MANAKKLPSGNYRAQVFAGYKIDEKTGKKKPEYVSFTHPDKIEAEYLAAEFKRNREPITPESEYTVKQAVEKYIAMRSNILSPTTIAGYKKIVECNLQGIMDIKIKKLKQDDIQAAVNTDALTLKPKTISNAHTLLSSVLKVYKPFMRLTTALPQKQKQFKELPSPQAIFKAVRNTDIELAALLAMWLSFTVSEIKGLMKSDIKDGVLTLRRVMVDVDGKSVVKDQMKEYERSRRHVVPPYIMSLIDACGDGYLVPLGRHQIIRRLTQHLKDHNVPHITFHDLRHVNASVMHLLHIPDKYAMERGGWKTDATMKAVYQNVFTEERLEVDKKINDYFNGIVDQKKSIVSHNISHGKEKTP